MALEHGEDLDGTHRLPVDDAVVVDDELPQAAPRNLGELPSAIRVIRQSLTAVNEFVDQVLRRGGSISCEELLDYGQTASRLLGPKHHHVRERSARRRRTPLRYAPFRSWTYPAPSCVDSVSSRASSLADEDDLG
jgi:hypothetical protein